MDGLEIYQNLIKLQEKKVIIILKNLLNLFYLVINVRPLEMSGAIGQEQIKKLPNFIKIRRENAKYFQEYFSNHNDFYIQKEIGESSWFGFSFVIKRKFIY